jgi:hypothetical protein
MQDWSMSQALGLETESPATSALAAELSGYSTSQAATVLSELVQVSDHLPVVADYRITAVPDPSALALVVAAAAGAGSLRRRPRRTTMQPRPPAGPATG